MNSAVLVVYLVVVVLEIAAMWRVFTKAGHPGWGAIIPIYNTYLLCKTAGKPGWWLLLFLIPLVNIGIGVLVYHGVSKSFGKGAGFTVGLIFLPFIFIPILAWGDARYLGAGGRQNTWAPVV
ncbi:MAG TPA: DUF5684 domain-containing protein [Acidimicrobiales bacterium]|nr:DUF5684 domain-containing protein [Acidimicrobiales bacterium]